MSRLRWKSPAESGLRITRARKAKRRSTAFSWSVFPLEEERTLLSGAEVGLVKDINQVDASPTT